MKKIIYTDGSSLGNPGPGGYAYQITSDDGVVSSSEGYRHTTNNRMELKAIVEALKTVTPEDDVEINSDSRLIIDALNKRWLDSWSKNGWKKSDKKPVLNVDLWKELHQLLKDLKVKFKWVEAHVGIEDNEECDRLAKLAAENPTEIDEYYEKQTSTSLFESKDTKKVIDKASNDEINLQSQLINGEKHIIIKSGITTVTLDKTNAMKIFNYIKETYK